MCIGVSDAPTLVNMIISIHKARNSIDERIIQVMSQTISGERLCKRRKYNPLPAKNIVIERITGPMIHRLYKNALERGTVGSEMEINTNSTPPGNRNKVGTRKAKRTGKNTNKLNLEAFIASLLIDNNNYNLSRNMTH
jgi:hypothetical protein